MRPDFLNYKTTVSNHCKHLYISNLNTTQNINNLALLCLLFPVLALPANDKSLK
jgi:hypothetical protein